MKDRESRAAAVALPQVQARRLPQRGHIGVDCDKGVWHTPSFQTNEQAGGARSSGDPGSSVSQLLFFLRGLNGRRNPLDRKSL